MKINNVEIENIDLMDADTAEKIEKAIDEVLLKAKDSQNLTSLSDIIKTQCTAIFDCFNYIFGEGTDKKIFGDKVNLKICLNAFEELMAILGTQRENTEKEFSKYSSNRATRRQNKK